MSMTVYIVISYAVIQYNKDILTLPVLSAGVYATEELCRFIGIPKAREIKAFQDDTLKCYSFTVKDTK